MSERKIRRNRKHQALILLFHSFYHSFFFCLFSSPTFSCSAPRVVKSYLEDETCPGFTTKLTKSQKAQKEEILLCLL